MLGISNTLFLIYPVRMVQSNAADFQLMGRLMLLMLLQFLILIPGLGIPAALGGVVFWLSGSSWPAFAVDLVARARGRIAAGSCSCWPGCSSGLIPARRLPA